MAYVDDLVVSGESLSVQKFSQEIQKVFSLKHIDYLTSEHPVEFLGRVIKKEGQVISQWSLLKVHWQLVESLWHSRVTTNGVKIQPVPKDQIEGDQKSHSLFRTAVGKLLWMSQLRDDIKCPIKELSRSLSNPIHLRHGPSGSRFVQAVVLGDRDSVSIFRNSISSKIQVCLKLTNLFRCWEDQDSQACQGRCQLSCSCSSVQSISASLQSTPRSATFTRSNLYVGSRFFSGSAGDSHSKVQRSVNQNQMRIHTTSVRDRELRIKRLRRFRHSQSRLFDQSRS